LCSVTVEHSGSPQYFSGSLLRRCLHLLLFLCQLVNTATSSLADDVHHYVIPPKVTIDK
jgi:hypothetical protein